MLNKGVKLCNFLDELRDIEELYTLHQSIKSGNLNIKPKETDEELISRLKSQGVTLYRKQSDIPEGRKYDQSRELLRAINRVKKNNSNKRKRAIPQNPVLINKVTSNSVIQSNMKNEMVPQHTTKILPADPQNTIATSSGFIMEILPADYIHHW